MFDNAALQRTISDAVALAVRPLHEELERLRTEVRRVSSPRPLADVWHPSEVAQRYGIRDVETVRRWCKNFERGSGYYIEAEKEEYSDVWKIPRSEIEYLDSTNGKPRRFSRAT